MDALCECGIRVRAIISDMGRYNMQIWTLQDIFAHRTSKIPPALFSLDIPLGENHYNFNHFMKILEDSNPIYFIANATHLFKSLRNMRLNQISGCLLGQCVNGKLKEEILSLGSILQNFMDYSRRILTE